MKLKAVTATLVFSILLAFPLLGQGFKCDGSMFIIVYDQEEGISILYEVIEEEGSFITKEILLSDNRRLSSLSYNVDDLHLYAIDNDSYEIVKIDASGLVTSIGIPEDMEEEFIYKSGTFSPNGTRMFILRHNDSLEIDDRFYKIDIVDGQATSEYVDISNARKAEIADFAVDPITSTLYGFENESGRLVQMGVGGQIAALEFPATDVHDMDGLFFNAEGDFFGFSAKSGFYSIDLVTGQVALISRGPNGTLADACSCPYTYKFTKEIIPEYILPCQEFEVVYSFENRLGIQQSFKSITDTFPEGFEILDFESQVAFNSNILPSPINIMSFEKVSFLMRNSEIRLHVRAPEDFVGLFSSQARIWDVPFAYDTNLYSDNPNTEELDETQAIIIDEDEFDIEPIVDYNCDQRSATIRSPLITDSYSWSTGASTQSITIDQPGWYTIRGESQCFSYQDSFLIDSFPIPKVGIIEGMSSVKAGAATDYSASINKGNPISFRWTFNNQDINCDPCTTIKYAPLSDGLLEVTIIDQDGCTTKASKNITIEDDRSLYAPNVFSPNQDNLNDTFYLQSDVAGSVKTIEIMNRWGNLVYKTNNIQLNNPNEGWNGSSDGVALEAGVYLWVATIEYVDGITKKESGTISIL